MTPSLTKLYPYLQTFTSWCLLDRFKHRESNVHAIYFWILTLIPLNNPP
ncbi:MAG: Uncharacterised protein [Formosa sp. Hel1_33_131]|nr:MAG: Uncharacterised protein [Formosa sp. Hel1_33_131]